FNDPDLSRKKAKFYSSYFYSRNLPTEELNKKYESFKLDCELRIDEYLRNKTDNLSTTTDDCITIANELEIFELELIRSRIVEFLVSREEVTHSYFAYGEDLHIARFKEICPKNIPIGKYYIKNHSFYFNIKAKSGVSKNMGVLNILPEKGEGNEIHGIIYALTGTDYERLKQSKTKLGYNREKQVKVYDLNDDEFAYYNHGLFNPKIFYSEERKSDVHLPNKEYVNIVKRGIKQRQLENYSERLHTLLNDVTL
ncbi:MAG: gamma-glutamylcyclotransferase family protein, partial [Bacteroidota bacterium]